MTAVAPPGPADPAWRQSLRWLTGPPLGLLESHQRRFGDVFRLELLGPPYRRDRTMLPLVRRTVIVCSAPADVREVFARNEELRGGEAQEFFEWFLGRRSLMVQDGPDHSTEKRSLLSLLSAERQEALEPVLAGAAERAVGAWEPGGPRDLGPMLEGALDAMGAAVVFGSARMDRRLAPLVARARRVFSTPFLSIPMLRFRIGRFGPGALPAELRRGFARLLDQPAGESATLFDLLRELPPGAEADRELFQDRLVTLLSGMDATTPAVLWMAWHLVQRPESMARAREDQASYLDAVGREVLRLHPVFPAVGRRVAAATRIGGYDLPVDSYVMVSMYLLHRRPELFPEPSAFRPERFLEAQPKSGSYLPFGVGSRHCLGAAFAPRQLRALFAAVLRRWDIRLAGTLRAGARRRGVAIAPAGTIPVILSRR